VLVHTAILCSLLLSVHFNKLAYTVTSVYYKLENQPWCLGRINVKDEDDFSFFAS